MGVMPLGLLKAGDCFRFSETGRPPIRRFINGDSILVLFLLLLLLLLVV